MATCGDAARSCRPSGTAARCDPAPERPAEQPESTCSRVPRNVGSRRPHCRRLRLIGAQLKEPILAPVARTVGVNGSAARAIIGGAPVTNSPLTASQIEAYTRDGALLVSGLIAPELCRAAADAMWQQMGAAPRPLAQDRWALKDRPQPRREDRSTWPVGGSWVGALDCPEIIGTFTPGLLAAAEVLGAAYAAATPYEVLDHHVSRPTSTLALTTFPAAEGSEWGAPKPHVDSFQRPTTTDSERANGEEPTSLSGWRIAPRPLRIQMIAYITGPRPGGHGGGGTVAWPGSSRLLDNLHCTDPEKYAWMEDVASEVEGMCKEAGISAVEMKPQAGDVLFYDLLCGHTGSICLASEPRLAFNHKFGVEWSRER